MRTRGPRWVTGLVAILVSAVLVLSGCSASPPDKLESAAKAVTGQVKNDRKAVATAEAGFKKKLGQPSNAFMQAYTPAQLHADRFAAARAKLDQADTTYKKEIKPLLDNYEDKKKARLEAAVAKANKLRTDARTLAADPSPWLDKVYATKSDPKGTVRGAATAVEGMKAVYTPLNGDVESARKTYANNAAAIDRKFQPFATQYQDALRANGLLQVEARKPQPNYAVMTEHATTVQNNAAAFKQGTPAFKAKIASLGLRESHTLVDIRVDSTVEISRTTWYENSYDDYPTEHNYDYTPVLVDLETANYFAKFKSNDVLVTAHGDGTIDTNKANRAQWNKLRIDPRNPKWIGDDNTAEFYVGEIEDTYCNKVRVAKNGKPDASGKPADSTNPCAKYNTPADLAAGMYWAEADDLDADAIGMDIYAKGLGEFDDQADQKASPPGMVYVGDPSTGKWEKDSNGNEFWAFYGQYAFFSQLIGGPNPYHYRYEYDQWNGGYRHAGRPYYSSVNGRPRYGGKSPLVASRFPGSVFVRSGLQNMTVRGAGPAARAGGPGGGGK